MDSCTVALIYIYTGDNEICKVSGFHDRAWEGYLISLISQKCFIVESMRVKIKS